MCFPGLKYLTNKSDYFFSWTAADGEISEFWIGGTDDHERMDNLLGKEYSTVFLNEISQISFDAVTHVMTRIAQKNVLRPKMYLDCNPPPKSHWAYKYFHEGMNPDGSRHGLDVAWMVLNPIDNLENLTPEYLKFL